jgi:hypothetical protein
VKINDVPTGSSALVSLAQPAAAAAHPPTSAPAPDETERVTHGELQHLQPSITASVNIAASERSARLHTLTQVVRSGTYRPNASQLADQILAEAELDTRLAKLAT